MSILGVITNDGLNAAQLAALNEGFNLVPTRFGVSDVAGTLDPNRDAPTSGQFYTAPISSRVIVDQNTIKFVLTVPPNQIPANTFKIVREVYIYINDDQNNEFLFAVGQPTDVLRYNADQELTLDVDFAIVNQNLQDNFVFQFTQATEISEHVSDPNAHPEYIEAMRKAGIFIPAGAFPFERRGQTFEDNGGNGVEFDGTKATVTNGGITFTSTFNGTELNGLQILPDGTKTVDELRADFNAANFPNTIEHDGTGTEVLSAGTLTLTGGSYVVQDKDIVYRDTDGVYKRALADGSLKSRVAGVAFRSEKLVVTHGLIDINTGFGISEPVYLSGDIDGALTNFNTNINLGLSLGDYIYFTGFAGDVSANVSQEFDAIVTNATGLGQYPTTQEAIDAVPQDGRILINKLEQLKATIDTKAKNLHMVFNGPLTGWQKFDGLATQFRLDFDSAPTQGTFRIEWNAQETNDIPFNATAQDIENEFNLLEGSNGFTVTGDFTSGFIFTSNDLFPYPLPTFTFSGLNEIQRFDFSNVPNDGTITFRHKGQTTLNFPWDDSGADLEVALEALSTITDVIVTGEFSSQFFQLEFTGGFLADGVQEQPLVEVVQTDLDLNGTTTDVNGTTITPIPATVVQKGKKPASNLFNSTTPINITVTDLVTGQEVGPDTAIEIDSELIRIEGMGKVENFQDGIVLLNPASKLKVEAYFPNTVRPMTTVDKLPGLDTDIEAFGYAKDVLSQLRIVEHPTNKKRVKITGADQILASGITLTSDLNSLLMDFEGAEIDFSGANIEVFEADGTTPLGLDIVRPTPIAEQFRWISINIIPLTAQADLTLKAQLLLLPATQDGSTLDNAEKPPFGDKPIGLVALEGALGDKELTEIVTTRDTFNSLRGTTLILEGKLSATPNDTETVAFWVSDPSLDTYNLEESTGVVGADQSLFDSQNTRVLAGLITPTANRTVDSLNLYLQKNGSPTGDVSVRILGDNLGEPDLGNIIATGVGIIDMTDVPTNFSTPVRIELNAEVTLNSGTRYYVEIDGTNLVITAGNFLGWNSEDNGATVEIFNRDPLSSTWLTGLGNRTAHFELLDKQKGIPVLAQGADRNVEVTTILENDLQSVVAQKFNSFINADPLFNTTINTNRISVENTFLGAVTDANMGDTGFFANVLTQGTDTDASGIEDITNRNIRQLGSGTGGGAGSGGGPSFLQDLKFQLKDSNYGFLTASVFSDEQDSKLSDSNGSYSYSERGWSLEAGQFLTTINLLTSRWYTEELSDISQIDLTVKFKETIDDLATYEASIDGGNNWQTIPMERIGESDTFVKADFKTDDSGYTFATVSEFADSNTDGVVELNASNQQRLSQSFVTNVNDYWAGRELSVYLSKLGSPTGNAFISIVKDNGGVPSLDAADIVFKSNTRDISLLAAGANTVTFTVPYLLLEPNTRYHILFETDTVYKANFTTGVDALRVNADTSSANPEIGQAFDGTSYSAIAGTSFTYLLKGRVLDLRIRITASQTTLLDGFGVFYGLEENSQASSRYPQEIIYLNGDDNVTIIPISQFKVNPDTILLSDLDTGQSWLWPAFSFAGNNIQVPSGTFDRPNETIRLKAILVGGGTFSNDENINSQLAENHLGSLNSNQDKSVSGRGFILRNAAGQLVEIALDEFNNLTFTIL